MTAKHELDERFTPFLSIRPLPQTKDVIDPLLFERTDKEYLKKVVGQVNAAYHYGLWDCCAVMSRRLLETLIIEVYIHEHREKELKNGPHFMQFSGLMGVVEKDTKLNLTRNAMDGLKDFKRLGDLSAHSRMFNAIQSDIDPVKPGMRVAAEELLHKAMLIRPAA